jgi:hypothetical protein
VNFHKILPKISIQEGVYNNFIKFKINDVSYLFIENVINPLIFVGICYFYMIIMRKLSKRNKKVEKIRKFIDSGLIL